jgi:hypothetical protein
LRRERTITGNPQRDLCAGRAQDDATERIFRGQPLFAGRENAAQAQPLQTRPSWNG